MRVVPAAVVPAPLVNWRLIRVAEEPARASMIANGRDATRWPEVWSYTVATYVPPCGGVDVCVGAGVAASVTPQFESNWPAPVGCVPVRVEVLSLHNALGVVVCDDDGAVNTQKPVIWSSTPTA